MYGIHNTTPLKPHVLLASLQGLRTTPPSGDLVPDPLLRVVQRVYALSEVLNRLTHLGCGASPLRALLGVVLMGLAVAAAVVAVAVVVAVVWHRCRCRGA